MNRDLDQLLSSKNLNLNSTIRAIKDSQELQSELNRRTSYLDKFIQRDITQRLYHIVNNTTVVDVTTTNWPKKFQNFSTGYHKTKYWTPLTWEKFDDRDILSYIKNPEIKIKNIITNKRLKSVLINNTSFLDDYNCDLTMRLRYLKANITTPLISKNNTLLPPTHSLVQDRISERCNIEYKFDNFTYDQKIEFLRNWMLIDDIDRKRFKLTQKYKRISSITEFIKNTYRGIIKTDDIIQNIYNIIYGVDVYPLCPVCKSEIHRFKSTLGYAATCSSVCNNKFRDNIAKRIKNNKINSSSYQTNIGNNKNRVLDTIERISHGLLGKLCRTQQIKSYFVDGVFIDNSIVVEVNESHHLYLSQLKKDIQKYSDLVNSGYSVVVVFDNLQIKRKSKKRKYDAFVATCKKYLGDKINFINFNDKVGDLSSVGLSGIERFKGVRKQLKDVVEIKLTSNITIKCTYDHSFLGENDNRLYVSDILPGMKIKSINGYDEIITVTPLEGKHIVYDLVDCDGEYYVAGNVLNHNCLFIDELAFLDENLATEFWRSVYPTISSAEKSKILIASTPNGVGNLFHKLWMGAIRGDNGFGYDEIKWDEPPGRTEEFKRKTIEILGSYEAWLQEFENVFLQHGDGAIDHEYFDKLMKSVKQPIGIYEDGAYRIFDEPKDGRIYAAGVDTAEGIGKDYSIINIYDLTDLSNIEQVAIYSSNKISPYDFTTKVNEILTQWGKPLALVERNGVGAQVADNLRNRFVYEKLVNWGGQLANRKQQNGVICHSNTKNKAVTNMRYWVSELKCVRFNDVDTIREFRDFTRYPNGTWAAKDSCHDDKVMSTVWALMALYDDIVQQYFEIAETDDNGKPKRLVVSDFGMGLVVNPKSIYSDDEMFKNDIFTLPCVFGLDEQLGSDINMLEQDGWSIYE